MRRGCGLMQFHWSTFAPSRYHDQITDWAGGYFDYEKGDGAQSLVLGHTDVHRAGHARRARTPHPAGASNPFTLSGGVLLPDALPAGRCPRHAARPHPPAKRNAGLSGRVGHAAQRTAGAGSAFTGGHFYKNWWLPDYRQLILNAIVWTAGMDVPAGGVESRSGQARQSPDPHRLPPSRPRLAAIDCRPDTDPRTGPPNAGRCQRKHRRPRHVQNQRAMTCWC